MMLERLTFSLKKNCCQSRQDPRAMLVTEIGGARPPNEIGFD